MGSPYAALLTEYDGKLRSGGVGVVGLSGVCYEVGVRDISLFSLPGNSRFIICYEYITPSF